MPEERFQKRVATGRCTEPKQGSINCEGPYFKTALTNSVAARQ
jgi:hypothetical protein